MVSVSLPVASPRCGKVLLIGEGTGDLRWPIPCVPHPVPGECAGAGVTCYASRQPWGGLAFSRTPRQRGFAPRIDTHTSWSRAGDLDWLPVAVAWDRLVRVEPLSTSSAIRDAASARRIRALQSHRVLVAWVEPLPATRARVLVRATGASSEAWWVHRATATVTPLGRLHGDQWLEAPGADVCMLLVAREPEAAGDF